MIIKNVNVYSSNKTFNFGSVFTQNGFFSDKSDDDVVIDGDGLYAIPGLIDIHFHGCNGFDFCDGNLEAIESIAKYQAQNGVTSICPATMSLPYDDLNKILCASSKFKSDETMAELVGINLEGPYINPQKCGAHSPSYIRNCDFDEFDKLICASNNLIKLVTIAPETNGAMDFIKNYKNKVRISIGHTDADYNTAKKAFDIGASHITHLFNAMTPFSHREPGVIGAAFDSDCFVELICDGFHNHKTAVNMAYKLFTDDRIVLISDSMRATGLDDGEYSLGGQEVVVKNRVAKIKSTDAIAGSVYNLFNCVKSAVSMGIPFESAIKCAAENPAKAIGLFDKIGSIDNGKQANLLLVDKDLNLKQVILRGQLSNKT